MGRIFFNSKLMDDFIYKDCLVCYLPHPKLYGNYEIYDNDKFVCRVTTKAEAKKEINKYLKS